MIRHTPSQMSAPEGERSPSVCRQRRIHVFAERGKRTSRVGYRHDRGEDDEHEFLAV